MAGPRHQTLRIGQFTDGVNNVFREDSLLPTQLREAVNVDLLPDGKVQRRSGYTRRLALPNCRSAASHLGQIYMASHGDLVRVNPLTFEDEVIAEVSPTAYLSFESHNEYLYVTDGVAAFYRVTPSGQVQDACPENPSRQPSLSTVSMGSLPAGRYQVAITFLRGSEESGTSRASQVTLGDAGAIALNAFPTPQSADTTGVRVYCSHTEGDILYHVADLPVGASQYYITGLPEGKQLETQFLEALPVGHIVRAHNGRLYSAVGNVLYFSEALRYGLCQRTKNYITFDGRVTMVRPVEGGIYVSAGKRTHFISGQDPAAGDLRRAVAHHSPAVEGTDILAQAGLFAFENLSTGFVAVWWAASGIMVIGLPNGQVQPLREGELALPEFRRGHTAVRQKDGVQSIVSLMQEPGNDNALAAKDELVATVYRNNIEV